MITRSLNVSQYLLIMILGLSDSRPLDSLCVVATPNNMCHSLSDDSHITFITRRQDA